MNKESEWTMRQEPTAKADGLVGNYESELDQTQP